MLSKREWNFAILLDISGSEKGTRSVTLSQQMSMIYIVTNFAFDYTSLRILQNL